MNIVINIYEAPAQKKMSEMEEWAFKIKAMTDDIGYRHLMAAALKAEENTVFSLERILEQICYELMEGATIADVIRMLEKGEEEHERSC